MRADEVTLLSVLVVEDDAAMQARIQRVLQEVAGDGIRIIVAGDVGTARSRVDEGSFTLALVDVQLPDGSGIDFIGWLRAQRPALPTVVVSSWAEEETILAALRNGAIGYLLKNVEDIELALQLRSLQRGGAPIDPVIARRLLQLMPQVGAAPQSAQENHLSVRETEVLHLVARGLSNREIADTIGLSRLTIESHTRNIYRKLAVGSRTAAVFEAQLRGLLH